MCHIHYVRMCCQFWQFVDVSKLSFVILYLQKLTSDPCEVWRKCLYKCGEVLEACVDVIGGVEEAGLKEEIAGSEEGRNKLRGIKVTIAISCYLVVCICAGIAEVYRLSRRVYSYLKEKEPGDTLHMYCMYSVLHALCMFTGAENAEYTRSVQAHWASLIALLPNNVMVSSIQRFL